MQNETTPAKPRGIVHRLDPKSVPPAGDVTFSPDYTVTSTTDGGGLVLTDVEVILCFWGSFWTTTPAPSPSSDDYKTAIEGILSGPYMGGLRQFRGVGQGTLIFTDMNDSTDPANGYTDADVVAMLTDRLNNTSMPPPTAGHNRFYAVIVPVGINNSLTQFAGQHQSFTFNGVKGYYAWVDNTGSLTGHNCVTKVFSHELVEACCTNPDVDTSNNSILVNGKRADGTLVTNDEIGDTCNNEFATVDMNGVQCSVQSYWSKADNACILPLGTVTFWVDKSTFGRDEVQDIIDVQGGSGSRTRSGSCSRDSASSLQHVWRLDPAPTGSFLGLSGVSVSPLPRPRADRRRPARSPSSRFGRHEGPAADPVSLSTSSSRAWRRSRRLAATAVFGELDAAVRWAGAISGASALDRVRARSGGEDPVFHQHRPVESERRVLVQPGSARLLRDPGGHGAGVRRASTAGLDQRSVQPRSRA